MPSVDVAMERSMRDGALNLLAASLRPLLDRRAGTITESVSDVKTAFSSWDNCMKFTYCKWPVIALIIIGGLIIFSVVWCLVRCLCCGLSCCCSCFSCLKCCGNCCGCCDPPKGKQHKYLDDTYHPPNQGYRSQEPMHASPPNGPKAPAPFAFNEPPKYAEFDVSKKGGSGGNDDALPAMPSWEGSATQKVAVEETVELEQLKKPSAPAGSLSTQNLPPMAGATLGPSSPTNPNYRGGPYNAPGTAAPPAPYPAGRPGASGSYLGGPRGYNGMNGSAYGQQSATSPDQTYDGYDGSGSSMGQGRGMPGPQNGAYGRSNGYTGPQGPSTRQGSYDDYGMGAPQGYDTGRGYGQSPLSPQHDQNSLGSQYARGANRSPAPHQQGGYGYGDAPSRSPAPQGNYGYSEALRRSPAPEPGYGGYGPPNNGFNGRSRGPQPQRKYSSESTRPLNTHEADQYQQYPDNGPSQPPISPAHYNEGYPQAQAFGDGYGSRPRGPSRQNTGGDAYPGYQAYQPAGTSSRGQQGWSGV